MQTFLSGVRGGLPLAAEQIDLMLRVIEASGAPVERFADLGCGNGILAGAILGRHPAARATLVDFSDPMIEQARAHLSAYAANLRLVMADLSASDWVRSVEDQTPFDVIVSGYAIHHQPDQRKRQLYGEVFGLLRPGGLFLNLEHVASPTPWVESISNELFVDTIHAFHAKNGSAKSREDVAIEYVFRPDKKLNLLTPVERQCGWLRELGFEDVDCYFKVFELALFGGRRPKA